MYMYMYANEYDLVCMQLRTPLAVEGGVVLRLLAETTRATAAAVAAGLAVVMAAQKCSG